MIPILLLTSAYLGAPVQLHVQSGVSAEKTEWRGDVGAAPSLKVMIKPTEWFGLYLLTRLGMATVDERMLTMLTLGAQIWPLGDLSGVRPYLRLGLAHQHEETLSVVANEPAGAIFGIGDGIRHRGGLAGGVGTDIAIYEADGFGAYGLVEVVTNWFYDARGPQWYVGGGVGLGLSYDL